MEGWKNGYKAGMDIIPEFQNHYHRILFTIILLQLGIKLNKI